MEAHVGGVEAEVLAVGAVAMAVVGGGQIGGLSPGQVEMVIIACKIMAGTSRLGKSARGRWNQMGDTTQEFGAKPCRPSWLHHRRRSQGRTTESSEYCNWLYP